MKRLLMVAFSCLLVVLVASILTKPTFRRPRTINPGTSQELNRNVLDELKRGGGILIESAQLSPQIALSAQSDCEFGCSVMGDPWFPGSAVFAEFHVRPKPWVTPTAAPVGTPTPTPVVLAWQEHAAGNIPPVSIYVSWGGSVQNMEISAAGVATGGNNIRFHQVAADSCDNTAGGSGRVEGPGGAPCIEQVDYDIDWKKTVGGKTWDWIYFWVRDPDFVAMKGVLAEDCDTDQWPYEYVNRGPKYYICQTFSETHEGAHGYSQFGVNVDYDVLYQPGAPPTPTSGATVTPPVPITATPCPGIC